MKRTLNIGDVVVFNNGQKFRVIYSRRNEEDIYLFVGIIDWNVYFKTGNLEYGIGDEILKDSELTIKQIMSKEETPTTLAIVG